MKVYANYVQCNLTVVFARELINIMIRLGSLERDQDSLFRGVITLDKG